MMGNRWGADWRLDAGSGGLSAAPPPRSALAEPEPQAPTAPIELPAITGKPVVYQVFTRLHGNRITRNKAWGTIADNGVGKFADFDATALASIKALGTTHLWFTGAAACLGGRLLNYGIPADDPDVVKGRAGSPYAITDYFDVDPDLATDPPGGWPSSRR